MKLEIVSALENCKSNQIEHDRLNLDRDKQKNPSYESSSRIRKPGLRKPKQKTPSYNYVVLNLFEGL